MKILNSLLCLLKLSTIFATATFKIDDLLTSPRAVEFQGKLPEFVVGSQVRDAGDFNKDGFNDIIIGSPDENGGLGTVYLVYGKPSFSLSDLDLTTLDPKTSGFKITGREPLSDFGKAIAGAGDVNGDGYADIMIGAPLENLGNGAVYVIYGRETAQIIDIDLVSTFLDPASTGFEILGGLPNGNLGARLSGAGDINDDKIDDIIICAPNHNPPQGVIYVLYKKPDLGVMIIDPLTLLDPNVGFRILGAPGDYLRSSAINRAGDINDDGIDDIIIGAPNSMTYRGRAYVIYGKSTGFVDIDLSIPLDPSTTGFSITGNAQLDFFGNSVSSAGDINGDNIGDIIIGATGKGSYKGGIYVIYGGKVTANINLAPGDSIPATIGFSLSGESGGDNFGSSVSCAGDINQDGYDDIFISAYAKNYNEGTVYVIYGGASLSSVDVSTLHPLINGFSVSGASPGGTLFGESIGSGVDDYNGKKKTKLLVGASSTFNGAGSVYAILPWKICSENCDSCNYPTSCTICSPGYGLETNSKCKLCPPGTYYTGGPCADCPIGCSKCTSSSVCQDCHQGFTLSKSNLCDLDLDELEEVNNDREKATGGAFEGTSIAGAALNSGSSLPINFGLVAKILRNVKYLNISVSTELQETFHSWKVNGGFLKAPKSWSQESSSKPLPMVFSRYKLDPVFLINYWKPFIMTLIGFALFGIFKIVEILMLNDGDGGKQNSSIPRRITLKEINIAASNFALTQIYSNLDDVIFYFILDVRSTELDGVFRGFSLTLSVIMLLIGGAILGLHAVFLRKYQNLKAEKTQQAEFLQRSENMKLIFQDFKDKSIAEQSFLLIQLVRSLICSLFFVLLFEYPLVQTLLLLMLNIGMIVFLVMKRPFKDFLGTCSQVFCEIILLLANICMLVMAIYDETKSHSIEAIKSLSRAVVVLNVILLIGSAILMVLGILKGFYTSYQEKKKAEVLKLKPISRLQNATKNKLHDENDGTHEKTQNQLQDLNSYQQEYSQNYLFSATTGGENYNLTTLNDLNRRGRKSNENINLQNVQGYTGGDNNFEQQQQQLGSNTSFYQQKEDMMNISNANLLPYHSPKKAEYLPKTRMRGKIKMPGGVEFQPRLNPINQPSLFLSSIPTNMEILNRNEGLEDNYQKRKANKHSGYSRNNKDMSDFIQ